MPFIKNLGTLGIDATLRIVDPVQYRARVDDFDFDITVQRFSFSTTPGDSLRTYFSSQAAALKGSQNLAGIADPAIDALIEKIIAAETRPELVTACRALDRVIRAGRYWIPHWYKASHWIAYWDVFGRPADQAALCARHSGDLVVRPRQGGQARTAGIAASRRLTMCTDGGAHSCRHVCPQDAVRRDRAHATMTAYIIRRILFMIPTLFGIMLVSFVVVQFAPGGPVERVIAQLSGSDTGATSRISGSPGGDFGARGQVAGRLADRRRQLQISRRAGPRSRIHQEPGEAVRLRQAGARALLPDAVELSSASISARAISATSACSS